MAQRKEAFDQPGMLGKEAWGHALYEVSQGRLDPFHFERCFGTPALLARARAMG
jgi:general secretion pathway protein E